ncbi:MAG: disulfide oxidoreductase [Candidatus Diapherotrites archaeon CG10_big_fil_rev_8_21_14_0_10_31_34]|nr:MAG: disulfide oxidoreductase [Candidatus Diapherotrites archaeon CG10_big_fil_rev_8_21_14_0_10_31_34]
MSEKKITKETNIAEMVGSHPETALILFEKGIHCIGCHAAQFENLGQGLQAHGLGEEEIKKVLKELNKKIEETQTDKKKEEK